MKILTMCRGGNVRSVTLAYLFKYKYGIDSLACGWERNSTETNEMLFDWADLIITVEPYILEQKIPQKYHHKAKVYAIGEDIWGMALHPELIAKCDACIIADTGVHDILDHSEWPDAKSVVESNQIHSLNKLKNKEFIKLNGHVPGFTAEDIWNSLSKEGKYSIKKMMYKEKIIHDMNEFDSLNLEDE